MGADTPTDALELTDVEPRLAAATWERFYENCAKIVTYRHVGAEGAWFLKVAPPGASSTFESEVSRMRWGAEHLPVPEVCGVGETRNGGEWMLTRGLPGHDGTRTPLRDDPRRLAEVLACGLRRFHDVPTDACPFAFRLDESLALVQSRVERGLVDPANDFHPEHAELSVAAALTRLLRERPETEDLVVCHGDYCLPNALIEGETVTGFVDLGEVGVADRWWDLAVATWSVTWNLGPGHEQAFLDAYGAPLNHDKLVYYRLLYDLVS